MDYNRQLRLGIFWPRRRLGRVDPPLSVAVVIAIGIGLLMMPGTSSAAINSDYPLVQTIDTTAAVVDSAAVSVTGPNGSCSGVAIAPDLIATAGHCVYDNVGAPSEPNWRWTKPANIAPGANLGSGQTRAPYPFGTFCARRLIANGAWVQFHGDEHYDYGAIEIGTLSKTRPITCSGQVRLGKLAKIASLGPARDAQVQAIGYPGNPPSPFLAGEQLYSTCPVLRVGEFRFSFACSILKGMSGGPVFLSARAGSNTWKVAGITTQEVKSVFGNSALAISLTREGVKEHYQAWIKGDWKFDHTRSCDTVESSLKKDGRCS